MIGIQEKGFPILTPANWKDLDVFPQITTDFRIHLLFSVLSHWFSVCVWAQACESVCVETTGQLWGTGSLLPHRTWGVNLVSRCCSKYPYLLGHLHGRVLFWKRFNGWVLTLSLHFCELSKWTQRNFTRAQGAFNTNRRGNLPNVSWIHL